MSGPGLDVEQFRAYVVRPTLRFLDPEIPYSEAAELLLAGTAMQESHLRFLDQLTPGPGPAYGIFQMEARTHADHWRWLARPENEILRHKVEMLAGDEPERLLQLRTNLAYACAMARIHYRRISEPLPDSHDSRALGSYWKRHYNTVRGRGTVEQWLASYRYIQRPPDGSI
jgi:hypothetical protein